MAIIKLTDNMVKYVIQYDRKIQMVMVLHVPMIVNHGFVQQQHAKSDILDIAIHDLETTSVKKFLTVVMIRLILVKDVAQHDRKIQMVMVLHVIVHVLHENVVPTVCALNEKYDEDVILELVYVMHVLKYFNVKKTVQQYVNHEKLADDVIPILASVILAINQQIVEMVYLIHENNVMHEKIIAEITELHVLLNVDIPHVEMDM